MKYAAETIWIVCVTAAGSIASAVIFNSPLIGAFVAFVLAVVSIVMPPMYPK